MRPPLNAGENGSRLPARDLVAAASMRPPLNAGENVPAIECHPTFTSVLQ